MNKVSYEDQTASCHPEDALIIAAFVNAALYRNSKETILERGVPKMETGISESNATPINPAIRAKFDIDEMLDNKVHGHIGGRRV
jgi:hypothetical protein